MDTTLETLPEASVKKHFDTWMGFVRAFAKEHVAPKFDIVVQLSNAKIRRMSRRRQKIAFSHKPSTTYKDCHLVSVGDIESSTDGLVSLDITFEYIP